MQANHRRSADSLKRARNGPGRNQDSPKKIRMPACEYLLITFAWPPVPSSHAPCRSHQSQLQLYSVKQPHRLVFPVRLVLCLPDSRCNSCSVLNAWSGQKGRLPHRASKHNSPVDLCRKITKSNVRTLSAPRTLCLVGARLAGLFIVTANNLFQTCPALAEGKAEPVSGLAFCFEFQTICGKTFPESTPSSFMALATICFSTWFFSASA